MYYDVYIDIVFLTNLLMDYLLLRLVGAVLLGKPKRGRMFFAALCGSLVSCAVVFFPEKGLLPARILLHGGCACVMVIYGLGLKKRGMLLKGVVTLYLMAFLMGGFLETDLVQRKTPLRFLGVTAGAYLGLSTLLYFSDSFRARWKRIYPVTLAYQGNVQQFLGFLDTGNLLIDPVNGKEVFVVTKEVLETMLPGNLKDEWNYFKEEPEKWEGTALARLRPHFLSYHTVNGEGVMLAVILEDLCIQTPKEVIHVADPVLAVTAESSALGKEYQILLNSKIMR